MIHHNISSIKFTMYALVVLLNINVALAGYGEGATVGYVIGFGTNYKCKVSNINQL